MPKDAKVLCSVLVVEWDDKRRAVMVQFDETLPRDEKFDILAAVHQSTTVLGASEFIDIARRSDLN